MTYYASFDHTTPEPQPVRGWFDTEFYDYTLPPAEDLLELSQQQWDDRQGKGQWAVQGGSLVPYVPPLPVYALPEQAQALLISPLTINCTTRTELSGTYANNLQIRQSMTSILAQINAGLGLKGQPQIPATLTSGHFTDAEMAAAITEIGSHGNNNLGFDITVDGVVRKISARFGTVQNALDLCNIINGQLLPYAHVNVPGTAAPWWFLVTSSTSGPTSTISYAVPPTSLVVEDPEPFKVAIDMSGTMRLTQSTGAIPSQGSSGLFNWPDINNSQRIWPKAEFVVYANMVANFVYQCQQVIDGFSTTLPSTTLVVTASLALQEHIRANSLA